MFAFNDLILQASPRVVEVDRLNADDRVEGVLAEEHCTACEVGHDSVHGGFRVRHSKKLLAG